MNITFNVIDLILILIVINLLLFAFFLFFRKGSTRNINVFLGLFFFSLAINVLHAVILRVPHVAIQSVPHVLYIGAPFAFLYAPSLFYYIAKLTHGIKKSKPIHLFHLLPFVLFMIYLSFDFYFLAAERKIEMVLTNSVISYRFWVFLTIGLHIQIIYYIGHSVFCLRNYEVYLRTINSLNEKINLSWVKFIFISIFVLWIIDLTRFLIHSIDVRLLYTLEAVLFITFLGLCYIILYKAVNHSRIFNTEIKENKKNSLSALSAEIYLKKLLRYMKSEKPYKDPDINLIELGQKVGIPHRSLSEVINNTLNQNFHEFINSYRVRESERLLRESSRFKTVLEVIYEVGFNSKSSFHSAFKKNTGMTPTQFKRLYSA